MTTTLPPTSSTATLSRELDTFYFMRKHSPDADVWIDHFLNSIPRDLTTRALRSFQTSSFVSGLRDLREYRLAVCQKTSPESPMQNLALRWYYSVLAYYFYCRKHFDLAVDAMDAAQEAVLKAFEQCKFLLPLLQICEECLLQKARIERERGRWEAMEAHIGEITDICTGKQPLHCTASGQKIYRSDVNAYFRNLNNLTDVDLQTPQMHMATDEEYSRNLQQIMIGSLYIVPGFVIPYGMGVEGGH